jgi:hypothetical protein
VFDIRLGLERQQSHQRPRSMTKTGQILLKPSPADLATA